MQLPAEEGQETQRQPEGINSNPAAFTNRRQIMSLVSAIKKPAVYFITTFVEAGCLIKLRWRLRRNSGKGEYTMSYVQTPNLANTERLEPMVSICQEIRNCLERRRDQVCHEITNHPTPIPACDVHFNRLLEERTKIFQELGRLDKLQADVQARKLNIALLEDFIGTSEAINDEIRSKLKTALKEVLPAGEA